MDIKDSLVSVYKAIDTLTIRAIDAHIIVGIKNVLGGVISTLEQEEKGGE